MTQQEPKLLSCPFCGLPLIYRDNTVCPNGCVDRNYTWQEVRLLRNELRESRTPIEDTKRLEVFKEKAWKRLIEVCTNIQKGKGEWPKENYVRDQTWDGWFGEYNALKSLFYTQYPTYVELDAAIDSAMKGNKE